MNGRAAPGRRVGRISGSPHLGPVILAGGGVALVSLLYGVLELGAWLGTGRWLPGHPVTVLAALVKGQRPWTGPDTAVAASVAAVLVGTVVLVVLGIRRRRQRGTHVDRKARHMGGPAALSGQAARAKGTAGRLTTGGAAGLMFGQAVLDGTPLYAGWREGMLIEMGPGAGKTTGLAVPLVVDAPGVVVTTSNKRDLADGVRGACEARGTLWVFDPQRIANYHTGGAPTWWWNPLAGVTGPVVSAVVNGPAVPTPSRDRLIIPRTAAGQAVSAGHAVPANLATMLPGDLIAFDSGSRVVGADHVGVYIGGGRMIDAPESTKDVQVDNVASGYYSNTAQWSVRRIG